MRRFVGLCAVPFLSGATQPSPAPLAPTGPWVVGSEENLCMLTHAFGDGAEKLTIGFQPLFLRQPMELYVLRTDRSGEQHVGQATVTFTPGGTATSGRFFSVPIPKENLRMFRITLPAETLDQLNGATQIAIKAPPLHAAVLLPKTTVKAMAALTSCQTDLLKFWGVDPALVDPDRAPKVRGNLARFFGPDEYPKQALHAGVYGRVVAALQVDATGAVGACRVVASAGAVLNDATCANARRITFDPVRDVAGKPVPSIYMLAVRWTLPGAPY